MKVSARMEAQPPGGDIENYTMATPKPRLLAVWPAPLGSWLDSTPWRLQNKGNEEVEIHLDAMQVWQFSTLIHFNTATFMHQHHLKSWVRRVWWGFFAQFWWFSPPLVLGYKHLSEPWIISDLSLTKPSQFVFNTRPPFPHSIETPNISSWESTKHISYIFQK